jgi:hypothetical protein
MRTRGFTALERSVANQIATEGLNQVLGCTNLTLAPTGSHMNKQVQITPTRQSVQQDCTNLTLAPIGASGVKSA